MDGVQFPLVGNSIIMAVVILIHVFFAFFAVGGLSLAVAAEWWGTRRNDSDYLKLARGISGFLSDMMKVNGVLGVAIVVLTIGLWSQFGAFLYSVQFWIFLAEGGAFLCLMLSSITYHNTWDRAPRSRHMFFGICAALFALLAGFLINSVWAFMMVPGRWIETHSRWDAFFTPILFESSLHILLPCLINAALLVFLWTMWKSRKAAANEQAYYQKLGAFTGRIGATLLFLQPLSGISFLFKVKSATENLPSPNPWAHLSGGLALPFLIAMIALATIAAFCAALYWALGHNRGRRVLVVAALAMFAAFFMGAFTRERARKPYLVWNTMGMNQQFIALAPIPASPPQTQTAASQPSLTNSGINVKGEDVLKKARCQACHSFKGEGGTFGPALNDLKPKFDRQKLMAFLRQPPPPVNMSMSPFRGTDEELGAMVDHLLK